MKKLSNLFQVVFLGGLLYTLSVIANIISVVIASALAGIFLMPVASILSRHTDGAFPELGYFGSVSLSFILIFTSYIGARGVGIKAN